MLTWAMQKLSDGVQAVNQFLPSSDDPRSSSEKAAALQKMRKMVALDLTATFYTDPVWGPYTEALTLPTLYFSPLITADNNATFFDSFPSEFFDLLEKLPQGTLAERKNVSGQMYELYEKSITEKMPEYETEKLIAFEKKAGFFSGAYSITFKKMNLPPEYINIIFSTLLKNNALTEIKFECESPFNEEQQAQIDAVILRNKTESEKSILTRTLDTAREYINVYRGNESGEPNLRQAEEDFQAMNISSSTSSSPN